MVEQGKAGFSLWFMYAAFLPLPTVLLIPGCVKLWDINRLESGAMRYPWAALGLETRC